MNIKIKKGNRKIKLEIKKTGFFRRGTGLMFRGRNTENLLFEFNRDVRRAITSYFCFFPFFAVWLDSRNNIVEKKIVKPFIFSLRPSKEFRKFIELPINAKNSRKLAFFVGKSRKI